MSFSLEAVSSEYLYLFFGLHTRSPDQLRSYTDIDINHGTNSLNKCIILCVLQKCYTCECRLSEEQKHHCRACGRGFCDDCSSRRRPVPERGWTSPVRVCDECFTTNNMTGKLRAVEMSESEMSALTKYCQMSFHTIWGRQQAQVMIIYFLDKINHLSVFHTVDAYLILSMARNIT